MYEQIDLCQKKEKSDVVKVVMAVGSSGGHLFPALALGKDLRKNYHIESIFLGYIKEEFQYILEEENFTYINLKIRKRFFFPVSLLHATVKSFFILLSIKPKIVLGTGSFGSFPTCVAGFLLNIPLFICEQNLVMGKANYWLSKIAKRLFLAFPNPSYDSPKSLVVGNPLNISIDKGSLAKKECYQKFNLSPKKKTLLVFGGSQGASPINCLVMNSLRQLEETPDWQVLHITGKKDYRQVKEHYEKFKIASCILPFFYPMDYAYKITDLAVSRGGALSLSELSFWGVPALIIPYPQSKNHHQESNARYFEERGAAYLIREEELQNGIFLEKLKKLTHAPLKLQTMREQMKEVLPRDAGEKICEEIYKYIT